MSRDKDYDKYCLNAGIENRNRSTDTLSTDELERVKDDFDVAIKQRDYALKTVVAFKEENTHLRAMNFRLVETLASQEPLATTHYEGCWDSGPKHYECALLEVKRLQEVNTKARNDMLKLFEIKNRFTGEVLFSAECESLKICVELAVKGGANLSNANLSYADLRNANLSNANLSNADLYNADLYNADLSNANLHNANLYNADLRNANLSNADLYNAEWYS